MTRLETPRLQTTVKVTIAFGQKNRGTLRRMSLNAKYLNPLLECKSNDFKNVALKSPYPLTRVKQSKTRMRLVWIFQGNIFQVI